MTIVLYKSNGEEYIYAQQTGIYSNTYTPNDYGEGCFWYFNTDDLPDYDWMYDPTGNIYGKVIVTVHISDGDTKFDETTIGVVPCSTTIVNSVISSDRTVAGCNIEVINTVIQNNANVIFDAKESTTINGTFEVQLGSELEIK